MTESIAKHPWDFQQHAVDKFHKLQGGYLADKCGLGKTLSSIETVLASRKAQGSEGPTLIICRKHAKTWWEDEIRNQVPTYGPNHREEVVITLGDAGKRPPGHEDTDFRWWFSPDRKGMWLITHHETLLKVGNELNKFNWEWVILDEAHRFKNRKAKRFAYLKSIPSLHRLALSGTPMHKSPADYWAILSWLYPEHYRSYWGFFERYVKYELRVRGPNTYKEITGAQNEEELAKEIGPIFLRRSKAEVLPDLPPLIQQTLHIEPYREQFALYEQFRKSKDGEVVVPGDPTSTPSWEDAGDNSVLVKNTLSRITRLQQILADPSQGPINSPIPSAKLDWVREYVEDNPHTPLLIFSKFREPVLRLANELGGALVIGSQPAGAMVKEHFLAGETNVLCGTIAAMGESLNLGRASIAIFIDQDWSTINMQQAVDRIHRADIKEKKHIITLSTPNSVDTIVQESLSQKWTMQELVYNALSQWGEV